MAYTGHGHQIPETPSSSIANRPKSPARCGGVNVCPRCKSDVKDYWDTNPVTVKENV